MRPSVTDHPFDVLIGHYTHAHVPTARSYIHRGGDGEVASEPGPLRLTNSPASPIAHTLLPGAAVPRETDASTVVETESFGWSDRDTTRAQRVAVDDRDTVLVEVRLAHVVRDLVEALE